MQISSKSIFRRRRRRRRPKTADGFMSLVRHQIRSVFRKEKQKIDIISEIMIQFQDAAFDHHHNMA
jgi:hypothetical protein